MKNLILFLLLSSLFIVSCKKDNTNNNNNQPPSANFNFSSSSYHAPSTVSFTNLSSNATSYYWDFGDGGNSAETNPSHTFSSAGNYTVTLTATNLNGNNSISKTVNVYAQPPSNVKILSIRLNAFPSLDPNGSEWDIFPTSNADVFYKIQSQCDGGTVYKDGTSDRYTDMPQSALPWTFNLTSAFIISNLNTQYYISFYDYDPTSTNDFMDCISFSASNYTSNYDTSVTLYGNKGVIIIVSLQWY